MYTLKRFILGVWESSLHTPEQVFLMVPPKAERKLVFVTVYPAREISSPTLNQHLFIKNLSELTWHWQKNKKLQIRLFGDRNPFTQQEAKKTDFYGVVSFELNFDDIEGMECSNSLIKDFSRVVFEANKLKKVNFESLDTFFNYYKLPKTKKPTETGYYQPTINASGHGIEIRTAFGVFGSTPTKVPV